MVSPHLHIKSMWVILNIIDLDWSVPARPVALIMDDKIVRFNGLLISPLLLLYHKTGVRTVRMPIFCVCF